MAKASDQRRTIIRHFELSSPAAAPKTGKAVDWPNDLSREARWRDWDDH
jgi:hypothetical protein